MTACSQHVGVAVAQQPVVLAQADAAQDQRTLGGEAVRVDAQADADAGARPVRRDRPPAAIAGGRRIRRRGHRRRVGQDVLGQTQVGGW